MFRFVIAHILDEFIVLCPKVRIEEADEEVIVVGFFTQTIQLLDQQFSVTVELLDVTVNLGDVILEVVDLTPDVRGDPFSFKHGMGHYHLE